MKNKIKLHILGVPVNKLGNWLIPYNTVKLIYSAIKVVHKSKF